MIEHEINIKIIAFSLGPSEQEYIKVMEDVVSRPNCRIFRVRNREYHMQLLLRLTSRTFIRTTQTEKFYTPSLFPSSMSSFLPIALSLIV